jgi:glycosyltransferase involved in cell wall biosynthesis
MPRLLPTPAGGVVGGAAANCVSLALELKRQGAQVELLASISPDSVAHLAGGPLADILVPLSGGGRGFIGKGLGSLRSLRRGLKNRLQGVHFDVIHCHSGTYPYAVVPLAADRRTCARLHSLYCPIGAKGGVYSRWWEKTGGARLVLERLDRVVAVTENVRRSLEDANVRPERIELVRMCVDTRRFCPRTATGPRQYFSSDPARGRIVFAGNGSREKGLLELLQAVKLLIERKIAVSVVAALENQCQTPENSAGYELAQRFVQQAHLESCVRFTGLVPSIEDLYAESDVVVIPWNSTRGPSDYPMVALEAMAMGKCVVSTPVGGCPDLLQHGKAGILTAGFSPQDIAAAVEHVVKNPALQTGVEQCARERVQELSLTSSASHLLTLYERLLEGKACHYATCCV